MTSCLDYSFQNGHQAVDVDDDCHEEVFSRLDADATLNSCVCELSQSLLAGEDRIDSIRSIT